MDSLGNATARYRILKDALQGKKQASAALLKACESQGGLAKLDLPSEGITPMALNTLKAKADIVIEIGGWEKLNEMRKSYLSANKSKEATRTHGRGGTKDIGSKLKEVEEALEKERKYRIRLQVAYEALLIRLRLSAVNDAELAHFINRHVTGFSFKRLSVATT